jgi:2-polyprenyl-3-methyl-5-hydroxy-6-metoxy-1,4-benzoquinol methylase
MSTHQRNTHTPALEGYAAEALTLVERYESVAAADKLRPVAHLLPTSPSQVADIGAGTGVDAAWLAAQGHSVLAVEPTLGFREAGQRLHPSDRIEWMDDSLPALDVVKSRGARFHLVLLSAVWAHLPEPMREEAMRNLASLLRPDGMLILSLRHGVFPASRPGYPASADQTIALARAEGLHPIYRCEAESMQAVNRASGVTWTWLAFRA